MKLLTSPSLLSAIVLRGLFIAAANHRKIDKPETLGRSHYPADDGRSRTVGRGGAGRQIIALIAEYDLRSYRAYMRGQEPRRSWEVLKRFGPQRLRVGTTALA